jgi:mRNA-degrading endonuclease RelE of RelBE toxin-antitoxin system
LTEAIYSLEEMPERGATTPEYSQLRQLLYGKKRHAYRLIYAIDESSHVVSVLHIRHGAQDVLGSDEEDHH